MANLTREEIRARIASVPAWWHNIDLGGEITPGITALPSQRWIERHLDADYTGKEVLDIGAWDGYYSFLAEARGARRVVAIDPGQGPCKPNGFKVAHEILGSQVVHEQRDVYDLGGLEGAFDRIFFFGVYYHLEDPILALHQIFRKLKPGGVLLMEGIVRSGDEPYLYGYRPGVDLSPGDFCAATIPWLELIGRRIGFSEVSLLSRYPGDNTLDGAVRSLAWHLRLHWGRLKKANRAVIKAVRPLALPEDYATDDESRDIYLTRFLSPRAAN